MERHMQKSKENAIQLLKDRPVVIGFILLIKELTIVWSKTLWEK